MIAILLLLATDPLLLRLKEAGPPPPLSCPFEIELLFGEGEDLQTQRMRVDPATGEAVLLDVDGAPMVATEGSGQQGKPDTEDGESTNIGSTDYSDVIEFLDLPFKRVSENADGIVFRIEGLPDGTVDLGPKDLSSQSAMELTVTGTDDNAYISRYMTELMQPIRIRMVARVNAFRQDVAFSTIEGAPRMQSQSISTEISVLGNEQNMGFDMRFHYPECDAAGTG